ncbi:hypothetical protein LOK49_LG08G00526 [Camellia lanceoleosa]|uniref:Uncharacterized protein n=1 Tax=Camellia lanceoleosa TaxID=1840588 RepID=A0ACC0GVK3_9ERIC|nr:hypothetical protein LOK49_LG08G00526 [Camellia lanceoleosa]
MIRSSEMSPRTLAITYIDTSPKLLDNKKLEALPKGRIGACDTFDDSELGNVAKNIGDHIHRYFSQAGLLLLDNKKLEALPKGKDRSLVIQDIVDFDDHLDDISKDWLNP